MWINETTDGLNRSEAEDLKSIEEAEKAQLAHNAVSATIVAKHPIQQDLLKRDVEFNKEKVNEQKQELEMLIGHLEKAQKDHQESIHNASKLHHFMHDADELNELIDQKLKIAAELDARDLSNIPQKVHQNANLRNDIAANQNRVSALQEDAVDLVGNPEVDETLQGIEEKWDKLQTVVHEKGKVM